MNRRPARSGFSFAAAAALALVGCHVDEKVLDPPGFTGGTWAAEPARMADAVVDTIAVGTHLGTTAPAADNYSVARQRLGELGARHLMDLSPQPNLTRVQELGRMGIRAQIWIDTLDDYFRAALAAGDAVEAFQVDPLAGAGPFDEAWLRGRRAFCGDLYAAVKGARPGASVVGPDVDFPSTFPLVDFGPCVDFGAVHRQRSIGPPTAQSIAGLTLDQQLEAQRSRAVLRPLFLGWDGYSTRPGDSAGAVSESAQAKYLARLVFEAFNRAFARVFLGGITDRPDDEQAADDARVVHFGAVAAGFAVDDGLTHVDGTPKAAFIGVRNLIALLADPGAAFATGALTYRLDGATEALHHTLLQKRDGTFFLALWLESPGGDAPTTLPITVRFPSAVAQVTTFVPQQTSDAGNRLKEVSALAIDIGEQVTLIQIAPYLATGGGNQCDRSRWTATASVIGDGKGPAATLDGDLTTRWDTTHLQSGMDYFQVDFGETIKLTGITLNNTQSFPADYPGAYAVYGSLDGVTFDVAPFASGPGAVNATVITFARRSLRAVKVAQVGTTNNIHWWGIGEFQITCAL